MSRSIFIARAIGSATPMELQSVHGNIYKVSNSIKIRQRPQMDHWGHCSETQTCSCPEDMAGATPMSMTNLFLGMQAIAGGQPPYRFWVAWIAQSGRPMAGGAAALRSLPRALSISGIDLSNPQRGWTRPARAESSPTASNRLLISALLSKGRHIQRRSSRWPPVGIHIHETLSTLSCHCTGLHQMDVDLVHPGGLSIAFELYVKSPDIL